MRIVVDTNIILSGTFWHGSPAQVYDAATASKYTLLTSDALTAELRRVLHYPKIEPHLLRLRKTAEDVVDAFSILAEQVIPVEVPDDVVRDPKDRPILACAVGGRADYIVSGDKDLLVLGSYEGIPILTADQFLERLSSD